MRQTFEQWMEKVEKIVSRTCGLSTMDLPDKCYADFYDDGMTAARAAKIAMTDGDEYDY